MNGTWLCGAEGMRGYRICYILVSRNLFVKRGRRQILFHICDALRDFGSFAQFKKRENTHDRVLLLVKLQAKSLQLY